MAFDARQVVAAFLTLSMFAMLGNMIKNDHFDSYEMKLPSAGAHLERIQEHAKSLVSTEKKGPWMSNGPELKPCWNKPASKEAEPSKGYITFSLTNGPEHHLSQITDAVVIARYLGATIVLPDIRGSELGQKRNFEDMYDLEKLMKSLNGVVNIVKELPAEIAAGKPAVVKVPTRVSEDFIMKNIEPIFRTNNYLRLAIFFPSINLKLRENQSNELGSTLCLAMFGSLELKQEIQVVADTMVQRLRTLSRNADGKFLAVDLRVDVLEKKNCKETGSNGRKSCYTAQELSDFLKEIGFDGETTVYLTQTWWHDSLNVLKVNFPRIYTKDDIIPAEKKGEILRSGSGGLERALDFHICSQSDAFVPSISNLFYGHITGKRIPSGRTQIIVPYQLQGSSAAASDLVSSYISKKNHLAYSCYC